MADWVIRGVPRGLERDMWWMAGAADVPPEPPQRKPVWRDERGGGRIAALVGLIALADWLFFGHSPGLSLAVFAGVLLAAVMLLSPGRERVRPALLLGVASLPVVEHVQALSLAFLGLGVIGSVLWAAGGTEAMGQRAARLLSDLWLRGIRDGIGLGMDLSQSATLGDYRRHLRAWAFPLGGALLLSALLIEANPVLGDIAFRLSRFDIGIETVERLFFWTGAALIIWPLIAPMRAPGDVSFGLPAPKGPGAASVARGLVMFNLILAVQTLMDAIYLWGGATLPEGMTAAEYAHRGAYPLLVTALLAGAFALSARPFAAEDLRLRGLLLLWLAQNVALTLSALLRLDLYVDAFGLTYLRVHAGIWMVLVAAGLGLTAWQVWRGLPNRWLLVRAGGLAAGTLYFCAFVNFAGLIAAENLSRPERLDAVYVCALGPMAAAEVAGSGLALPCSTGVAQIEGWRDWGFRAWRVNRYLETLAEGVNEDPRRG